MTMLINEQRYLDAAQVFVKFVSDYKFAMGHIDNLIQMFARSAYLMVFKYKCILIT